MRELLLTVAGLVTLTVSTFAAEDSLRTLKVGSLVYSNVTVTGHTPTVLYIRHAQGIGSVKLKDLNPELQQKYGYDAQKAEAVEALQKEAQVDFVKTLASQPTPKAEPEPAPAPEPEPAPATHRIYAKSFLGQAAPELVVEKWLTDTPELDGRFKLVTFWATWSPACRQWIPRLNEIHRKHGEKLTVIGLSVEPEEQVRELMNPKIEYSSAIDTRKRMIQSVEVTAIPHALLIDPLGIVRFEGTPDLITEETLRKILGVETK